MGGVATICLGEDSTEQILRERQRQRVMDVETPDAAPRFPQAPGGSSSLCLGSEPATDGSSLVVTRGPVGGAATLSLGDDSGDRFAAHRPQAVFMTPEPRTRFPQAPGGFSSVCLGGEGGAEAEGASATVLKGPVGGKTTINLSDCLPLDGDAELVRPKGAVGGESTISLGMDDSKDFFLARQRERAVLIATPDASTRFPQAPGGDSSVCLGYKAEQELCGPPIRGPVGGATTICFADAQPEHGSGVQVVAPRGPVGGATTLVLGGDDLAEAFAHRREMREASFETPAAAPRFPQAPGGVCSISLGGGDHASQASQAPRGPVGGVATIVLGGCDAGDAIKHVRMMRETEVETPAAAPRFPQAPGGTSALDLGNAGGTLAAGMSEAPGLRRPVGGASTLALGDDSESARGEVQKQNKDVAFETPGAAPRFSQAPGGSSSLVLGGACPLEDWTARGPVGGASNLVLGMDDGLVEAFRQHKEQRDHVLATPDAAMRFQQAPGGTATIVLGSGDLATGGEEKVAMAVRGPVGGAASVILGSDDIREDLMKRKEMREAVMDTPDALPRFKHAPGGPTTIILGGDDLDTTTSKVLCQGRAAPGGASTLELGGSYPHDLLQKVSANKFASGTNQNCGNSITERPTTRLHHAPGGKATISLGDADAHEQWGAHLSSRDATGVADQSSAPEERTSHASRHPGGASTLVFGGNYPHDIVEARKVSSNAFANGSNQNAGNMITERPSTRLHYAPGGQSTICLGEANALGVAPGRISSNKFANGANQNCGNSITDRPSTRIHHAPGGDSSICLSGEVSKERVAAAPADENVDTTNLLQYNGLS